MGEVHDELSRGVARLGFEVYCGIEVAGKLSEEREIARCKIVAARLNIHAEAEVTNQILTKFRFPMQY